MRSSDPTSDLVVLVCRRETSVALVDVLRNWSTLGLVDPVYVVDSDAVREGDVRTPAVLLEAGAARGLLLQEDLVRRKAGTVVRLVAVSDALDGAPVLAPERANDVRTVLTSALPGKEVLAVHVLTVPHGSVAGAEAGAWLGWHNVVLAPENSPSPVHGVAPVLADSPLGLRRTHAAAGIVSLAGLWSDAEGSPLDDRGPAVGRSLAAARTYSRHLSAVAVETSLLTKVADMSDGYPVPLVHGSQAQVLENGAAAAESMRADLFKAHPGVLPAQRVEPAPKPLPRIGAWKALTSLFRFLAGALRGAPAALMNRMVRGVSQKIANVVSGVVFGESDPAYVIVVRGVDAQGRRARWDEMDDALEALAARVSGSAAPAADGREAAAADLADFWQDYLTGGLTLLDGGSRSPALPPRTVGTRQAVLLDAGDVVPTVAESFPVSSLGLAGHSGELPAWDLLGARMLTVEAGEPGPDLPPQAVAARQDLAEWTAQQARSYTGQVGRELAKAVLGLRAEVKQLVGSLAELEQQLSVPSTVADQQRSLARTLAWTGLGALLALAAVVALVVGPMGRVLGAALGTTVLVVWLVVSLVVFVRGQRDLFALLHAQERAISRSEVLRGFLGDAVRDLRRLSRAYRQYGDWTAAYSVFVHDPLGAPVEAEDGKILIGSGLPRNHRFGAARPEPRVLQEAADTLRAELFPVGWLAEAWDHFLGDAPAPLGALAARIRQDPRMLLEDPPVARTPVLSTWSEAVLARGVWPGAAAGLQARVGELLRQTHAPLVEKLLVQVGTRNPVDGRVEFVRYADFLDGLDQVDDLGPTQFDRALFAPAAEGEPWHVVSTLVDSTATGLGLTTVVTQLSDASTPHQFAGAAPGPGRLPRSGASDWQSPL